jgi:monoamine oxidase
MKYDYVIVGAGIAGLHCALRISETCPNAKIAIAEMYNYTGGRIFTYKGRNKVQWESGAGRIHGTHKMVLNYIKTYNLTLLPISTDSQWVSKDSPIPEKDIWPSVSNVLVKTMKKLDPKVLASKTMEEIIDNTLLKRFPYNAEVSALRADLALKSFHSELGSNKDFFIVKEGLSELTRCMRKTLLQRGVRFLYNHRLISVKEGISAELYFERTEGEHSYITIPCDKAILAVHCDALRGISPFNNLPILKHIVMKPLLRTYGVFNTPWVSEIKRTITDSPLRHIIPINERTVMTSYTDANDTVYWKRISDKGGDAALSQAIVKELRHVFPKQDIQPPLFFKSHYWRHGCSYWLPGLYEPKEESMKIMCPIPLRFPNIFVCGESYSLKQSWIEGALEHSEEMLRKYIL